MKKKVRLIEMQGNFLILSKDPINTSESGLQILKDGSLSEEIVVNESESPIDSAMKIMYSSKELGWFATESESSGHKKIIRTELRPKRVQEILKNGGECEIECMVETKTFGTNEFNFYESDVSTPYTINNLPIINLI
jgi:hypothetical protein